MKDEISALWNKVEAMGTSFFSLLPNLILSLIVFALFFGMAKAIKDLVKRLTRDRRHARNLGLVLGRLAQGVTVLVGLFISLSIVIPSLKAGDLVQLLGISGVAIGFAFREILQNFLAGILILLTEPFQISDQIVFKDFEGTVESIETRATTIQTYDGRRIVIPNAELFTNSLVVNTAFSYRRLEYEISIGYEANLEQAKAIILQAMQETPGVLKTPSPDTLVVELGPSTIAIRARWWVKPPRRAETLEVQDRVLLAIKNRLTDNGIDLAYPTQQILFSDQTDDRQREGSPNRTEDTLQSISRSLQQLVKLRSQRNRNHERI